MVCLASLVVARSVSLADNLLGVLASRAGRSAVLQPAFDEEPGDVLNSRMQNETEMARALLDGLQALQHATLGFQAKPPTIDDSIRQLGSSLFDTMSSLLAGAGLTSQMKMQYLREPWEDQFARLPVFHTQISERLRSYSQLGNHWDLVFALSQLLNDAATYAVPLLPAKSASFFAKYFNALAGMLEDLGDSWDRLYQAGPQSAMKVFEASVQRAVQAVGATSLMPPMPTMPTMPTMRAKGPPQPPQTLG